MKRLSVSMVALTIIMVLVPNVAAAQYRCEMYVSFNPGVFENPANPIWVGTISGDIDGTMIFWATGPIPSKDLGNPHDFFWRVHFFTEYWEITDADGDMIAGIDKGNTVSSNWKFRMNGEVTMATGKYADLVGHKVHMNGQITWSTVFVSGIAVGPVIIT
ncbi:MAG: hypothetical protein ACFFAY_10305 [Promethearchaeota archaeon]